jgi:CubicO group peptidase (beta-lactamase class C family)
MENILNSSRKSVLFLTLLCALLLGSPLISDAAQVGFGYHGATQELVWRGTQALLLCNGLFVSNRTLDQIYAQEFVYPQPDGPDVPMSRDRVEINYDLKAVAIGVGDSKDLIPPMRAAHREGIGCVVMGAEQTFADINKLPKLEMAPLPGDPATIPWPDGDLVEKKPLPAGVNRAALDAAGEWTFDRVKHGGHKGQVTLSLLVVHRGNIIYERYAPGVNMHTRMRTWSTAKSISSTLTGIAVDKGLLDLDTSLPFTWPPDPRKGIADPRERIKLRDVLHMSSGLMPVDIYKGKNVIGSWLSYFAGWDSGYEARNRGLIREPGSFFVYENYDTLLGVFALRTVLANDKTYAEFPRRELFDRIGMRSTLPGMDRFGNYVLSSQVYSNTRDLARVGILYLNEGVWNGERILSKKWVEWVRRPAYSTREIGNTYGGQFWLVPDSRKDLPQDAYSTSGAQGQYCVIVPSYDLIIVRRGLDWRAKYKGLDQWDMLAEALKAFPPPSLPPKKLPATP